MDAQRPAALFLIVELLFGRAPRSPIVARRTGFLSVHSSLNEPRVVWWVESPSRLVPLGTSSSVAPGDACASPWSIETLRGQMEDEAESAVVAWKAASTQICHLEASTSRR